jgi:nucleotide-binding universal stress UspA family protein
MISTLFVPASGSDTDDRVFATALAVAQPLAAHLKFFHLHLPATEAARYASHIDFCMGPAIKDALDNLQAREDTLAATAVARYRNFCREHGIPEQQTPGAAKGVSARWLEESHDVLGRLMFHARHSDAVVLGRSRNRDYMPDGLIESLLVGCGRPVIIAPDAPPRSSSGTMLVAWKEAPESARALTAALPLLEQAEQIVLLAIDEKGAASREAMDDLARELMWHDIAAQVLVLPSNGRPANSQLAQTAVALNADMLVIGGFGHSQLREQVLGGVTQALIAACAVPVFIMH